MPINNRDIFCAKIQSRHSWPNLSEEAERFVSSYNLLVLPRAVVSTKKNVLVQSCSTRGQRTGLFVARNSLHEVVRQFATRNCLHEARLVRTLRTCCLSCPPSCLGFVSCCMMQPFGLAACTRTERFVHHLARSGMGAIDSVLVRRGCFPLLGAEHNPRAIWVRGTTFLAVITSCPQTESDCARQYQRTWWTKVLSQFPKKMSHFQKKRSYQRDFPWVARFTINERPFWMSIRRSVVAVFCTMPVGAIASRIKVMTMTKTKSTRDARASRNESLMIAR